MNKVFIKWMIPVLLIFGPSWAMASVYNLTCGEPGCLFECSSTNGPPWTYCNGMAIGGGTLTLNIIQTYSGDGQTHATLNTNSVASGTTIWIRPVDTGNNPGVAQSLVVP